MPWTPLKPEPPKPAPPPYPGVEIGDSVYFHHPHRGPMSARVIAQGQHGVTAACDRGDFYRIHWPHVLGVKERVARRFTPVDQGEDGMIVQDQDGVRRYVGFDDPDTPQTQRPAAPLRKAEPVSSSLPRPGLQLRPAIDKRGFATRRWRKEGVYLLFPQINTVHSTGIKRLCAAHDWMRQQVQRLRQPLHDPATPGKPGLSFAERVA